MTTQTFDQPKPTANVTNYIGWGLVALLWVAFTYLAFTAFAYGAPERHDFTAYYIWSESMVDGGPLYAGLTGQIYLYPPLLAQMIAPLVALGASEAVTATVFFAINMIAMVTIPWMLAPLVKPRWAKLVWIAPIFFYPFLHATYIGQVTIILAALLTAVWTSVREGQRQRAGLLLAFAAWLKVWPAYLVVYFILRRDWRVFRGVVIGGIALLIFQVVLGGVDLMVEYFNLLIDLFTQGQYQGGFQNLSVFGFASRLFQATRQDMAIVVDDTLFTLTRYSILAVLFGVTLVLILRKQDPEDTPRFDLEYSAMIIIALLSGSTLWTTALPPIYFSFVIAFKATRQPLWTLALIASFMVLTLYHPTLIQFEGQAVSNWVYSSGMFALLVLWGVHIRQLIVRQKA